MDRLPAIPSYELAGVVEEAAPGVAGVAPRRPGKVVFAVAGQRRDLPYKAIEARGGRRWHPVEGKAHPVGSTVFANQPLTGAPARRTLVASLVETKGNIQSPTLP